jgi:hypothetical protein
VVWWPVRNNWLVFRVGWNMNSGYFQIFVLFVIFNYVTFSITMDDWELTVYSHKKVIIGGKEFVSFLDEETRS